MIRKKVCMLGSYAVGKTSLVRRFVTDTFSPRYQTTIGVKITKKEVRIAGQDLTLLLWDLHGDDEFQTVKASYLRGASGLFFVVDGTRLETLETARQLVARAQEALGPVPSLLLANKSDLSEAWELGSAPPAGLVVTDMHTTSAKTGEGVELAFHDLGQRMVAAP